MRIYDDNKVTITGNLTEGLPVKLTTSNDLNVNEIIEGYEGFKVDEQGNIYCNEIEEVNYPPLKL